ncbi:MAG: hypothetical protein ABJD11_18470 [Gemmatimonadota bacterium]
MSRKLIRLAVLILIAAAVALLSRNGVTNTRLVPAPGPPPVAVSPDEPGGASGTTTNHGRGFRTTELLAEHFRKHGAEFGRISSAEYLLEAQALRDRPASGGVLELARGDGTITRFDQGSGAFIAFDADGTIRTFFKPNDGEAYFRRQGRRAGQ